MGTAASAFFRETTDSALARNHGFRNNGAASPDVAAGIPSCRENLSDRRADFAGKSGSLALELRADRGGVALLEKALKYREKSPASALTHCRLRLRPFMRRRNRSL